MTLHRFFGYIFKIWRPRRIRRMIQLLAPASTDVVLDVGGYPWFWVVVPPFAKQIDTINPHIVEWQSPQAAEYNIKMLVGDGCHLPFPDQAYDLAHSNSVIEHVGDWEKQKQFASEIRRVGKAYWVQTPAREFFIEPHYLGFGVHWLPKNLQRKTIRWLTGWGWTTRPTQKQVDDMVDEIRLLSYHEMTLLFPGDQIMVERFLGIFPKSYIAYKRSGSTSPSGVNH